MFTNGRRGGEDSPAEPMVDQTATYIGSDASVEGTVRGKGLLRIEGRVSGQVEHEGTVVVGQKAEVRAKLRVKELVVQGFIEGSIHADRCEIAETARIVGDVRAQRLAVAEGASIHGDLAANLPEDGDGATLRNGRATTVAEAALEQS
jgi:cytoskeletal protein CcmA (bactofilin family)